MMNRTDLVERNAVLVMTRFRIERRALKAPVRGIGERRRPENASGGAAVHLSPADISTQERA